MASEPATESIADRVAQSLSAFEAIDTVKTQAELSDSQSVPVQTISDQFSKFKLWAGNIGAHRTGRSSLDYRLRDSSHLHTQVMRLLDDLITSLNEVHSILSGETLPWDQDPGDAGELDDLKDLLMDENFEFDSELGQLTKEITDAVGNLLRLSISLRNPAPHDRFMSTEYAKVHYFEANDIAHTKAKFPKASQTLIIRLGQALSQRRQYFRYRESHHEKLARGLFDSGRSNAGEQSTVASSIPIAMRVHGTVSAFRGLDEDERSDTGFSQTSFATTAPESDRLRIPPLPKRAYEGPFECPFCFMLISVSSTHQWKKHVLRDLRPYICLAENCITASREYGGRHEWINHMYQNRWITWVCPYQCRLNSTTKTNLRQHITRIHGSKTEMELDTIISRCGQSTSPSLPIECPFCQDALGSVKQYQRHVGRHQVDLALFALPKIEDDEEPDEANGDQDTISTRSGSYSEAMSDISPTALAEQTETITGIHEEGQEAELELGRIQLSEDNGTKRQDIDRFANEINDIEVASHLDSRGQLHPLPPIAKPATIEREIITHYRDIDHGVAQAEGSSMQDREFVDKLDDAKQELGAVHPQDSREEPAPASPIAGTVIINGRIYRLSDSESEEQESRTSRRQRRPRASSSFLLRERAAAQEKYEVERVQKELGELKPAAEMERDEERELLQAQIELIAIREKKLREEEEERRIKQEQIAFDHQKEAEASLAEKKRREKEAKEAVEKYKKEEAERVLREKEAREMENPKLRDKSPTPTYTRFARRHLSLETLRVHDLDYYIDEDPEYVVIKRWVPESEQDTLWEHTREIRKQRDSVKP
ncbi:hypothetical protein F4782DRAFT_523557 [Xylaria castorea]|nr:hypothetical protein F4782DRAFT_523557 [Xylaria castorea]